MSAPALNDAAAGLPRLSRRQQIEAACRLATPQWRGWQHAVAAPAAGAASVSLALLAPPGLQGAVAVFAITTILLFGVSAVYHATAHSVSAHRILQRWDHANIFLVIAGSATPFAVAMLGTGPATELLALLWFGALGGALLRLSWASPPPWLFLPLYLALGWAAVLFLPHFRSSQILPGAMHVWVLVLLALGGVLYSVGALVFATKWPNPSQRVFGYHEVFHTFTLGGWLSHFIAAALVVGAVR